MGKLPKMDSAVMTKRLQPSHAKTIGDRISLRLESQALSRYTRCTWESHLNNRYVYFLVAALCSCATVPPKPIRQEQSKAIYVEPMQFRLAKGAAIGAHYVFPFWRTEVYDFANTVYFNQEDLSQTSIKVLAESNYNTVHIVNKGNAAEMARYSLIGTVVSLSFNAFSGCYDESSVANVEVHWELKDPGGRLLYQTVTRGYAEKEGVLDPLTVITEAYENSVEYLLSGQGFATMAAAAADQRFNKHFAIGDNIPVGACIPAERPEDAAVFVRIGHSQASGIFLSNDGFALTSSHMVKGISRVPLVFPSTGEEVEAEVIRVDKDDGIALIQVQRKTPCVAIARSRPSEGATVRTLGGSFMDQNIHLTNATIVKSKPWLGYQLNELSPAVGNALIGGAVLTAQGEIYAIISQVPFYNGGKPTPVPIEKVVGRLRLEFPSPSTAGTLQ